MKTKTTPSRRKKPVAVSSADKTMAVTTTVSAAPPLVLLPPLTTYAEPCIIEFEGVAGDTVSKFEGSHPIAKLLAMAYAELTGASVTCNPNDAFELISYDPSLHYIKARRKAGVPVMAQKVPTAHAGDFGANAPLWKSRVAHSSLLPLQRVERPCEVPRHSSAAW